MDDVKYMRRKLRPVNPVLSFLQRVFLNEKQHYLQSHSHELIRRTFEVIFAVDVEEEFSVNDAYLV